MSSREITAGRENSRRRPRGYADWSPRAKTRVLLEQVNTVLEEYEDHLPLSVRQIFYRLVATCGYEKTERAYNRLSEALVMARRARLISFADIRDDAIVNILPNWYAGVQDFWDTTISYAHGYRRHRQTGQRYFVELWCEAAGMVPQLEVAVRGYSVPVYSASGFVSLTAVRSIVDRALKRTKPTVLLHVGDFDPSGEAVFSALADDVARFVEADRLVGTLRVIPVRVALTAEQVDGYELPTAPAKKTDSRARAWKGEACQLEALAPDDLARIVNDATAEWFDRDVLAHQIELERSDRAELLWSLPAAGETR